MRSRYGKDFSKTGMIPDIWTHQKQAIAKRRDRFCLFFDTGTGKTRTALEFFRAEGGKGKWIVIAPLNVCRNWEAEIRKFLGTKIAVFIIAGKGTPEFKLKQIDRYATHIGSAFLCINTESLQQSRYVDYLCQHAGIPVGLIIDECHQFKTADSARTQNLLRLERAMKFRYLYALTGTPIPNGEIDQWIYLRLMRKTEAPFPFWRKRYFVDTEGRDEADDYLIRLYNYLSTNHPHLAPEKNYNEWKARLKKVAYRGELRPIWDVLIKLKLCKTPYLEWRDSTIQKLFAYPKWEVTEEGREKFRADLSECSMTAKKNEVIDLPPLLKQTLYFEMDAKQAKAYSEMAKDFRTYIESEGRALVARNFLSRVIRLQQISAGVIDGIDAARRLDALRYAIEIVGDAQFLVWTIFERTYETIAGVLEDRNISYGMLTGDVKADVRQETMEKFQRGEIRAIVAHPKAGGIGVNLTAASYSIHYTKSYDAAEDAQAEARNYRGGSERHERITRIDILGEGTIDEAIHEAITNKRDLQDVVLTSLRGNE